MKAAHSFAKWEARPGTRVVTTRETAHRGSGLARLAGHGGIGHLLGHFDAIAAALLRAVHRRIGAPQRVLDAGVVSDEGGRGEHGSFTGAFAGVFAFDTSGRAKTADFDWFNYDEL